MQSIHSTIAVHESPVFGSRALDDFRAGGAEDVDAQADPRLDAAVEKLSLLIRRYCPTSSTLGNSSDH